jgi:hypothetical protein
MSFEAFAKSAASKHAVPTFATAGFVTARTENTLAGLDKVTGHDTAARIRAEVLVQQAMKETGTPGWESRFGFAPEKSADIGVRPDADPAAKAAPDARQSSLRDRTAKFAGTAFDFNPKT